MLTQANLIILIYVKNLMSKISDQNQFCWDTKLISSTGSGIVYIHIYNYILPAVSYNSRLGQTSCSRSVYIK